MNHGSPDTARAYDDTVHAARLAQNVPHAVAPHEHLVVRNGRVLGPGDEVRAEDLEVTSGGLAPAQLLAELVRQRRVITAAHVPAPTQNQVGSVAPGKAIVVARGVLGPRDGVSRDDMTPEALALVVARGLVILD